MVTLDDPRARAAYEDDESLPRMSFGDHLDELRRRLIKAVAAVLVCVFGMLPFKNEVQAVIIEPYRILWRRAFEDHVARLEQRDAAGEMRAGYQREWLEFCRANRAAILDGTFPREDVHVIPEKSGIKLPYELVAVGGIEDFWVFMMASFVFALVIAAPVVVWQAWAFIGAGLYKRERKVFYRYFPFMMVLLVAGVLFGYCFALPFGLGFLIRMMVDGLVTSMLTVGNYFTFLFSVTAAMGVIFQLPLVMVALQRIGLVRHQTFVKHWRVFVLVICALSAVLTPPDPFSMALMALPSLLLYGLGLVLTRFGRRHEAPDLVAAPAGLRAMTLLAEIVAIGDELVHGSSLDTNSRWLAHELEAAGLAVQRFAVVGDEPAPLASVLREACARADVVVATGGLGPTLDDRTRDVAAELCGGPLWFDERSWQRIQARLLRRRRTVPESNRRQAEFPPGAVVLDNDHGTAPAFRVRIGRAELFALPGVPREMQQLAREHVLPFVQSLPGRRPFAQHCLRVLGPPEALLGERIAAWMRPGREPAVGITASGGLLTVRIVGSGATAAEAAARCAAEAQQLRPLLGEWLVAEGTQELPEVVADRLLATGTTLALAESCTGGLVAARLTDVPGISAVLLGGVVAYADRAKTAALGVDAALVAQHGAVSEPVAAAMASGAAQRFGARLGLSVTGIAGPGGGTADKPVGTVCFGTAFDGAVHAWTLRIPDFGRAFVRDRAVLEAWVAILRLLRA